MRNAVILAALACGMLFADRALGQKRGCYVVNRTGSKVSGVALAAAPDGTLTLEMEPGGPKQTFKPGSYRFAYVPKPKLVGELEKAYDAKKYDLVAQHGPGIFGKYKYLGWGDYVAYLEGMALLDSGKAERALDKFELGRKTPGKRGAEVAKGRIMALVSLKRDDEATGELEKLAQADDEDIAAFAFNTRGQILGRQGKKKDAVLQYLKTLLLFEPGDAAKERDEAREQVVALLKEMNDPRAKDFEQFK